jgi:hypothetical protein
LEMTASLRIAALEHLEFASRVNDFVLHKVSPLGFHKL